MPWHGMTGDERRRFCSQCGHHVENLSLLSREQRAALLARARTERVCGAYYVRLSGEMVTPDNPLAARERRSLKRLTAASLSAGALALAAGCTTPPEGVADRNQAAGAPPATRDGNQASPAFSDDETIVLVALGMIACETPPQPPKNAPPSKRW